MAASSDDLADGEPFTPSAFLDLPPTPARSHGEDDESALPADLVLPVISRMLMEDTDEDELLLNRYPDHPSLLQAQRPFAQILSDTTAATYSSQPSDRAAAAGAFSRPAAFAGATWPYDPEELSRLLLSRTCPPGGEHSDGTDLPSSGQQRVDMDMLNAAFLKGMEEASKFLPTNSANLLLHGEAISTENLLAGAIKIRRSWDDSSSEAETGRRSKIMALEPEDTGEAVDRLIVDGYSVCMEKMNGLRIARIAEAEKKTTKKGNKNNNGKPRQQGLQCSSEAVDLRTQLIHCAQAMSSTTGVTHEATTELLSKMRRRSSPEGDATRRLVHCFAEGLEARLAGLGGQVYRSLRARPASVVDYFEACCFETVAYKFSSMVICNAVAVRKKVHIVDYGVGYGFQWPSLLAHMATWEGGPPEIRITGIDLPQPGFRPAARVEETGRRLSRCACELGVPFEFHGIVAEWDTVCISDLRVDTDEVLIVNSVTGLGNTMDEGTDVDSPSPRDVILGNIREMRPEVFIICVVNGSYGGPFFLSRFREALSYYSAVFDMLDDGVAAPALDNHRRLKVERDLIGRRALNVIACEGSNRVERPETYKQWQTRNRRAGLRQLPLCLDIVKRLREKVRMYYHREFVVDVDQQWVLQGWKGRILYAMSTWTADDVVV
ncbi:unnamed protein product [Urochloa humidicola]